MKNKLTIILSFLIGSIFFASVILGAPPYSIFRTLLPETNNTYFVGTSTNVWKGVYATEFYGGGSNLTGIAGGGATTTINSVSGPTFTFATSSDTNIGLNISTSTGQLTFTPIWIGTLSLNRVASSTLLTTTTAASTYVARNTWTTIDNYPSDCASNGMVYGLADTLSCYSTSTIRTNLALVIGTNVMAYAANNATTGSTMTGLWNGTAIDISSYTNLAAGRSLTMSGDSVEADNELFNKIITFSIRNATTTQNPVAQHKFATAFTITRISCSTNNSTSSIQFDERVESTPFTAGTDVLSAALVCTTSTASSTSFANAGIAADAPLSLDIDAMNGNTTTTIFIHVEGTYDD